MANVPRYLSKLLNTRVLVIGGTSGIGFCVAEAALEHGAIVITSSSSPTKVSSTLDRLRPISSPLTTSPAQVTGTACDLSDEANLETNLKTLLDFATAEGSTPLDHIVFTAGDAIHLPKLAEVTPQILHQNMLVRLTAPLLLAKLLPAYMPADPSRSLTLTSGATAHKPAPGWAVLVAAGNGVEGLMRGLAVDLAPRRVNVVSPGAVHTELWGDIPAERLGAVRERYEKLALTGTVGRPEDVAEAYVYCMKDRFVTGTVVGSDGGRLLT